jgi:hypothetical protein
LRSNSATPAQAQLPCVETPPALDIQSTTCRFNLPAVQ